MLKIKDNVDLSILEKYGFKKHKKDGENILISKWTREYCDTDDLFASDGYIFYPIIYIFNSRDIKVLNHNDETIDVLFDMIKDGIVEKVEGVEQ